MKINNINVKDLYTNSSKSKEDTQKNVNTKVEKSVNIQISDTAKALAKEIDKSTEIKFSEKVEKIRQSILDGNYKVSSEVIADKILETIEIQKGTEI